MTTLLNTSPLLRDLLYVFDLVLCLFIVVSFTKSARQKYKTGMCMCVVMFVSAFFLGRMIRAVSMASFRGDYGLVTVLCCSIPLWCYVVALFFIQLANLLYLWQCSLWDHGHISIKSIKESLDKLPSGLAFYRENGSCILVNEVMHELSHAFMGHGVLNGKELFDAVSSKRMRIEVNGNYYQFQRRKLMYAGEPLYELRADEMTDLVKKTEELKKGNAELTEMAARMGQLGLLIDETIKRQEILQAKIDIHNTMNRLLLTTSMAVNGEYEAEETEKLLHTWKNNALLLCMESDMPQNDNLLAKLNKLADMLGIELIGEGRIPSSDGRLVKLLEIVFHEAMTNTVKHGGDKSLRIKLWNKEDGFHLSCINKRADPRAPFSEGGGLSNLRRLIEQAGGRMEVTVGEEFILHIVL